MGYTTEFSGVLQVTPPLNADEVRYLKAFSQTRHMDRRNGPYHVTPNYEDNESDVIDHNSPPPEQPSLWCDWEPTDNGEGIKWNGNEKSYSNVEWVQYLINHFLKPGAHASRDPRFAGRFQFNHVVQGVVEADGEERGDHWYLVARDNVVSEMQVLPQSAEILALPGAQKLLT